MSDNRQQVRLRPVIRVFVSSTFGDMKHERNALAAVAFPKLEQLCQRQGFQFQAIDLRWCVSTEAGLDHRTMRICFDELRRAQKISPRPNFLILLGNRYGWRPLPEEISVEEFDELKKAATTDQTDDTDKHKSGAGDQKSEVSGLEPVRHLTPALSPVEAERESAAGNILCAWYRRDDKAVLLHDGALNDFVDLKQGALDRESQDQLDSLKRKLRGTSGRSASRPAPPAGKAIAPARPGLHAAQLCADVQAASASLMQRRHAEPGARSRFTFKRAAVVSRHDVAKQRWRLCSRLSPGQ